MRTVLAIDDLLAKAMMEQLPGRADRCSHLAMSEEGDDVALKLVERSTCTLVIGGEAWTRSPLDLLERWRLPYKIPVVLLLYKATPEEVARATRLCVFSLVDMHKIRRGLPTSLVAECVIAHAWTRGHVQRALAPVLLLPSPRPPRVRSGLAPVLSLAQARAGGARD